MAAYPGEGYKMSNYGLKRYSPEQIKEQWRENVDRQTKVMIVSEKKKLIIAMVTD